MVNGEYVWVTRKGAKRGGYIKMCHLRAPPRENPPVSPAPKLSTPRVLEGQRWVVMDASHDGAWLRKRPVADHGKDKDNVVCLLANGTNVVGDFVYLRLGT